MQSTLRERARARSRAVREGQRPRRRVREELVEVVGVPARVRDVLERGEEGGEGQGGEESARELAVGDGGHVGQVVYVASSGS